CSNLGTMLHEQGRLVETAEYYQQAASLRPASAEVHNNLGTVRHSQGDYEAALACYAKSLELNPDFAEAHYNRALVNLTLCRFEEGWHDWRWRLQCKKMSRWVFPQPDWIGEPLAGRTLLVHAEQGFGDAFLFTRYLRLLNGL